MVYGISKIDKQAFVTDIVTQDYRTAAVFRKHGIVFCCGTRLSLEVACFQQDLDLKTIHEELEKAASTIHVSNILKFDKWDLRFLTDYIVLVHHEYLRTAMPETLRCLEQFAEGHHKKYNYLSELVSVFTALVDEILPHMVQEEEIIFPYIKQIAHAYNSKESYTSLLERTLSKPVADVMNHMQEVVVKLLDRVRELTNNYCPPPNACTNHKVCFFTLREVDNDLVQYLNLENNILFPKVIKMEKGLLQKNEAAVL
jgi:regulator of cell morphogenesis and NO signaling